MTSSKKNIYILQAKFAIDNGSKNVFKLNLQRRRSIPNKIRKISRCRTRSVNDAELISRCFAEDGKKMYEEL